MREVLLLCWRDTGHPQGGGSERYLEQVGAQLAARGVRVVLRTASYPGAAERDRIDGITVSRGGGRLTVYPRALAAILAGRFGVGPLAGIRPDASSTPRTASRSSPGSSPRARHGARAPLPS